MLFRGLTLLMLGLFIVLITSNWQRYKVKLTPINVVTALFLLSFAISTFVGADWYRSFWDNHERMLGLFTVFHYVIYYFILTSVFTEWKEWKWMMRVFLGAGSIVMIIALLQTYVNHELLLNRGVTSRVSSTLGNSIYLSGYGLFLMFLGYLLAIKEKIRAGNIWFWYAVVGGILGFWGIFLGGTRGALLGFIVGLGVLLITYMFALKGHIRIKKYLGTVMLLGILAMGGFYIFRNTAFVQNIPAVGRLVNTEISSTNTRIMAWGVAVDAWKEKPIFGWGPNNYYYAFNKYYRPEFLEHGWGETWFDNAHSVIMNTLAVQGIFGITVYLGLYILVIGLLWRAYRKNYIDVHVLSVGSALLIAHLMSLITVFENPTSYLYFFFFLAFINTQVQKIDIQKSKKDNTISPTLVGFISVTILLLIYSTNINPARANKEMLKTIKGFGTGQDVITLYNESMTIPSPHIDDMRNDMSRTSYQAIRTLYTNKQVEEAISLFQLAYDESKKNVTLHPLDIRVHMQLAQLCMVGAEIKQDITLLYEAEQYLEEALVYSPKRQQLQYLLSGLKALLQKGEEGVQLLQDSIDNNPNIEEGWWRIAVELNKMGEKERAAEKIAEAKEQGIVFSDRGAQIINSVLADIQ